MKTKKLTSILKPMSEEKSHQAPSLDDEGIGDKIAGFSNFASPKKGNKGASVDINAFAQIVNKNIHNQSANDRNNKYVFAQSMIEAKQEIGVNVGGEKSGFAKTNFLLKNTKKLGSRPASEVTKLTTEPKRQSMIEGKQEIRVNVVGGTKKRSRPASEVTKLTTEPQRQPMNAAKSLQAASLDDKGIGEKAAISKKHCGGASEVTKLTTEPQRQVRLRRLIRNNAENVMTHSGQSIPGNSGQHVAAQSGQCVPTQSGQSVPAQSGQRVPAQSGQRVLPQSGPHSPTRSRQRTSQSGQSTPNESLQLTAQSRQQTPEAQSGQRSSAAQSEPNENIPTPSHPSTVNVSSTAVNDIVCWNIGSTRRDGRVRVEVINGILEPSYKCSAKNREIIHEKLEPT